MANRLTGFAQKNRKNPTDAEAKLWYQFLRLYPHQFRRQLVIGGYIVDFFCHRAMLAVEIDGGQHFEQKQMQQDARRTADLESRGIKVIRFNNLEVLKHFYEVCSVIDQQVHERIQIIPPAHKFDKS